MPCRNPAPRRGGPRPSRLPAPPPRPRPVGSSPIRQAFDRCRSIPNSLLVAAVPDFGDLAGDDAEHFHAGYVGGGAVTGGHGRVVDDRDVLAVVRRDDDV